MDVTSSSLLLLALVGASPAAPSASERAVLTLEEAVRVARDRQPQLRRARAESASARARADEARASLLPQLTASAAYQRSTSNFAPQPGLPSPRGERAPAATSWQTFDFTSSSVTITQLLWDFGQTLDRWRSAGEDAGAQRESERNSEAQVLLNVRSAYFTARACKDLVAVARENLANREAHLVEVVQLVGEGLRPRIDLAQARADRSNAVVQLVNAESTYETAKARLDQAMGVERSTDYDPASEAFPAVEGEDLLTDALVERALRARQDVAALERQVRARQLTVRSVRGGYLPSLGVSAGASDGGIVSGDTAWNVNASVLLTWNVFQGGLTRARAAEARANLESVAAQLEALRLQLRLEVEQARLAVRSAKASLSATGDALVNARERLRLAELRYQTGAGTIIELGDAQVAVTSAATQRVQAEYDLASARAQLLRALGRMDPT